VLQATGKIIERSSESKNPKLPTGTVELATEQLEVLNTSKPLPFPIQHQGEINEDLRLKYRFLDLRRDKMQRMLVRRHEMIKMIRGYMNS
jgi:aspartyl-tRNA synthetase